jgi:hypothetical protein
VPEQEFSIKPKLATASQIDISVDEIPKWTDEGFAAELRRFTNALSVGFPGREKSIFTPFW